MDHLSKQTSISLTLTFIGLCLLVATSIQWLGQRDPEERAREEAKEIVLRATPERNLDLLEELQSELRGIDAASLTKRNFFARPLPPAPKVKKEAPKVVETKPPPKPPAPTTRKIALIYRGRITSSQGEARLYLSIDGQMNVFPLNEEVVPGWKAIEAGPDELVLINEAGERSTLAFNTKKNLEVPVNKHP